MLVLPPRSSIHVPSACAASRADEDAVIVTGALRMRSTTGDDVAAAATAQKRWSAIEINLVGEIAPEEREVLPR